jgi:hypothetical protein
VSAVSRAKRVTNGDGSHYGVRFDCPGCGDPHVVPTEPHPRGWGWNGSLNLPTLTPSILVHPHGVLLDDGSVGQSPLCHSFVTDGRIQFCSDSTHALSGQTVDLPELPEP